MIWDKLDIYNDSAIILDKKIPKNIISWITILIILMIVFIILSFIPFNIYKTYIGSLYIENDNSYIVMNVNESDFPFNKNNKLYIRNKQYKYNIVSLLDNKLIIKLNLDDNLKIENNILRINILKNRTTLYKIIKIKIKKGFGIWEI